MKAYCVIWHRAPRVRQYIAANERRYATHAAWVSILESYGYKLADWKFRTVRAPAYDEAAKAEERYGNWPKAARCIGWADDDTREAWGCCARKEAA